MDKADAAKLAALVSAENRLVRWSFAHEGPDEAQWEIDSTTISEPLSCAYEARVDLTSDDGDASTLLGVNAVLTYDRVGHMHQVCGIISQIAHGAPDVDNDVRRVDLMVVPAFALLRFQTNSRVFQDTTVPNIVAEVLAEGLEKYGRELAPVDLSRDYPIREYTVQHRESDFDFVSRLLESEGIGYRFEHPISEGDSDAELAKEVMVLFDETVSLAPSVSQDDEPVPIISRPTDLGEEEAIFALHARQASTSTAVLLRDYDWTRPQLELTQPASFEPQDGVQREIYIPEQSKRFDYKGNAYTGDDIGPQATLHLEEAMQARLVFKGKSIVTGMRPGLAFQIEEGSSFPETFLLTSVTHHNFAAPGAEAGQSYHNAFSCIALEQPYRPARETEKPIINSIQTALVVGEAVPDASQQKIFVDAHGRVKVQFQWDRVGEKTEKNKCFLRCITPWAGAGFGVAFIPRVGMEVAVSFVNGDPDNPVISGCLYNADNPFPLNQTEATQSLIRTHSETGSGFNEMRFEDKDGGECISVHAERDYNEVVKRSHSTSVGGSQSNSVGGDQSNSVTGDQSITVESNRTKTVTCDEKTDVTGKRTETVGAGQKVTVTGKNHIIVHGKQEVLVAEDDTVAVVGKREVRSMEDHTVLGCNRTVKLQMKGGKAELSTESGDLKVNSASSTLSVTAKAALVLKSSGDLVDVEAAGHLQLTSTGAKVIITGSTEIALVVGTSSIVIAPGGVTINGKTVSVEATSGKTVIKGAGGVDIN